MATVKFSADDRAAAKTVKGVLFAFHLHGGEVPGFADKLFQKDGILTADQAEELGDLFRAKLKSYRAANVGA